MEGEDEEEHGARDVAHRRGVGFERDDRRMSFLGFGCGVVRYGVWRESGCYGSSLCFFD